MIFSSAVFLLAFLPVTFVINFLIKDKYSNIALLIASLIFYAWGEPILVLVMMLSILLNWGMGFIISRVSHLSLKRLALFTAVICDLLILGYYKYYGFAISILNRFLGENALEIPQIALPIGISFFTFQAISYVVDVYRGDTDASPSLINTALYISFFPQLIAGPIVKYRDINKQIVNRSIDYENLGKGFKRFIYGLSKKVLISNVLALCVDAIFSYDVTTLDCKTAWIGGLAYMFQLYNDFSGYSDMAIGLGKMFGFNIPENFDYPYLSSSVSELWRKWHISLSAWFREYVYFPLGGNRKGTVRTYINLLIVFFLTGLWHGAMFSYIVWGLYNGFFVVIERLGFGKLLKKLKLLPYIYSFLVFLTGVVIFRSNGTRIAFEYLKSMFLPWLKDTIPVQTWNYMDKKTVFAGICGVIGMGWLPRYAPEKLKTLWSDSVVESIYCIALLILCLASIASNTYNPFIYYQF